MAGRSKARRNTKRICMVCDEKIFNKSRSSLYCKEHGLIIGDIHHGVASTIRCFMNRRFPEWKISYKLKLNVTKK